MANLAVFNETMKNERVQAYLDQVLQEKKKSFVLTLSSLVNNNAALQVCEPLSIVYAAMKATTLDLPIEPSLGFAAIIPFNDKKAGKTLAQFQIMTEGWKELARRTNQIKHIANEPVYEGELTKANRFTDEYEFDETQRKSDKIIGYMAYIELCNGFKKYVYWDVAKVQKHAQQYSQTYRAGYGVWKDNFDAMALKTVLKYLIRKYAPKSIEMTQAINTDQTVATKPDEQRFADNEGLITEGANETPKAAEAILKKAKATKAKADKATKKEVVAEVVVEPEPEEESYDEAHYEEEESFNNDLPWSDDDFNTND